MALFSVGGKFGAGQSNPQSGSVSVRARVPGIQFNPEDDDLRNRFPSWMFGQHLKSRQGQPGGRERRRDSGGDMFDSVLEELNLARQRKSREEATRPVSELVAEQRKPDRFQDILALFGNMGQKWRGRPGEGPGGGDAEFVRFEEEEGEGKPTIDPRAVISAAMPGMRQRIAEQVAQATRASGAVGAGKGSPLGALAGKIGGREANLLNERMMNLLSSTSQSEADREERVKGARLSRKFGGVRDENLFNLSKESGTDQRMLQMLQMLMSARRGG